MKFKKRVRGTAKQIGKPFPILEKHKLPDKIKLPRAKKIILDLPVERIVPREKTPVAIDDRTKYFVKMFISGMPIEPLWAKRNSRGRYLLYDGHARLRAAKLLGIKSVQVMVMTKKQARAMDTLRPISSSRALQILKEMHSNAHKNNPGILQKLGISSEPEAEYYLTPSGKLEPEPA